MIVLTVGRDHSASSVEEKSGRAPKQPISTTAILMLTLNDRGLQSGFTVNIDSVLGLEALLALFTMA